VRANVHVLPLTLKKSPPLTRYAKTTEDDEYDSENTPFLSL